MIIILNVINLFFKMIIHSKIYLSEKKLIFLVHVMFNHILESILIDTFSTTGEILLDSKDWLNKIIIGNKLILII